MSLDGKEKTVITEDLNPPTIAPPAMHDAVAPDCVKRAVTDVFWFEQKVLVIGGPAGKGPEPPGPPPVDQDDSSQVIAFALVAHSGVSWTAAADAPPPLYPPT
jgi:hypothetical protein